MGSRKIYKANKVYDFKNFSKHVIVVPPVLKDHGMEEAITIISNLGFSGGKWGISP